MDRIYKTKECKRRITAEEMKAVIEERDAALSQVTAVPIEAYTCRPASLNIPKQ